MNQIIKVMADIGAGESSTDAVAFCSAMGRKVNCPVRFQFNGKYYTVKIEPSPKEEHRRLFPWEYDINHPHNKR